MFFRKKSAKTMAPSVSSLRQGPADGLPPFFILGCVRSGTTLLRDLLRLHPHLDCPEETHFFRWSDPFRSPRFLNTYRTNKVILDQQRMDGISESEFEGLMARAASRKELAEGYGRLYLEKRGNPNGRWFDKTPQNVYGMLLISAMFPQSKFVHIYRNPLNVVASLFEGKVMAIDDMAGATSYWMESMWIIDEYKKLQPERVYEVGYERLTSEPGSELTRLLEFLGEDPGLLQLPAGLVHKERNKYRHLLSEQQVQEVIARCQPFFSAYGYSDST